MDWNADRSVLCSGADDGVVKVGVVAGNEG